MDCLDNKKTLLLRGVFEFKNILFIYRRGYLN